MALLARLCEAAGRMMRDHLSPLFADAGLQPGEFDVLATLRRSGDPNMLSPTRLYEAATISSGGMTDRLAHSRARMAPYTTPTRRTHAGWTASGASKL